MPKGLESVSLVSAEEAVKRADIIVILVDHQSFFGIDWKSAKQPIIDTRGVLSNPAVANTKLKAC